MGAEQSKERELYDAVRLRQIAAIRFLRDKGASLDWISSSGKTPLILACSASSYLPAAILLLEMGADVNFYDPRSHVGTALTRAAEKGLHQTGILLLSHGANPLIEDRFGRNSLDKARTVGNTNIVRAIEDKICFFSGWLLATSTADDASFLPSSSIIWAVVLPRDYSLSRQVGSLNIALYANRQSPRPHLVIDPNRFTLIKADFNSAKAELIFSRQGFNSELKLLSINDEDSSRLRVLYDTVPAMSMPDDPPLEIMETLTSSPSTVKAPSSFWERDAIAASIQSPIEEGIPLSDVSIGMGGDENRAKHVAHEREGSLPTRRRAAVVDGRSEGRSSCVVCADCLVEAACVPCGHVAGCMECLSQVKRKGFGCPVCRTPIEQVLKIYTV
ncbi:putative E3 ubiquitin-protein ligase XBOS34 [Wolffia australiana]